MSIRESYQSRQGPENGPMPFNPALTALDVYDERSTFPIGTASPRGWICYRGAQAMMFRLNVGGVDLSGLWVCYGRKFIDPAGLPGE